MTNQYNLDPEAKWKDWNDDDEALRYLAQWGIKEVANGIIRIPESRTLSYNEGAAIDYLCDEWDFMFERTKDGDTEQKVQPERGW